ncbi:MAG: ribosome biogenesis GTP-binding protein YihA/YsxC [Clostridia bacterium]
MSHKLDRKMSKKEFTKNDKKYETNKTCPYCVKKEKIVMLVKNPKFEISAVSPKQYPKNHLPEIVLVGKSNVGKSSFVNTMINRKKLARTSSEPGKTRQINFYNIDDTFYFVDLPGYGYSKMSKKEQAQVGKFIEEYLFNRKEISLIIFLIDIRHSPSANDKLMYNYIISSGLPFLILANKADKIAITKVEQAVLDLQKQINPIGDITTLPFSSERKIYKDEVWKVIEQYIV